MLATELIDRLNSLVEKHGVDSEVKVWDFPSMSEIWRVGFADGCVAISLGKKEYIDE